MSIRACRLVMTLVGLLSLDSQVPILPNPIKKPQMIRMISSMIKQQKNKNSVVSSTLVKPIKLLLVDLVIASHIYLSEEGSDLILADLYLILPSFIGVSLHSLQHGLNLLVG